MLNKLHKSNKSLAKHLFLGMMLCPISLFAQITIGGDVYGGGKEGAVGTGNVLNLYYTAAEAISYNAVLPGAVQVGDDDGNGGTYTAESAAEYNSLLSGAVKEGDLKPVEPEDVVFATATPTTTEATHVTINCGTVRTVFGGGQNGRTYGSTKVDVRNTVSTVATKIGGTVNDINWTGTIHGGLFGAGDGIHAYVFGNSTVTIEAGTIYQNVYGGGNQAELGGNTLVTLQGGDMQGSVYGGARMADIQGFSEVNIDGANIKNDLVVNYVYGGNDISGTTHNVNDEGVADAYVHSSKEKTPASGETQKHIFIGQLYAGGNGDYHNAADNVYEGGELVMVDEPENGTTPATTVSFSGLNKPVIDNARLNLQGGTFGYVFGGGNFATINETTDIYIDNSSDVSTEALNTSGLLDDNRMKAMGLNPNTFITSDWLFNRVFGGNNKVDMAIRPTWHLTSGSIYNLYSGGNEGGMTYPNGIFLPIQSAGMTVENVYGGCRKADVNPGSTAPTAETLNEHDYQEGYAARVLVTAGKITNVYGGNDISGTVNYGTDLQILSSVTGDVYGGGNGAYVYTDNPDLADADRFKDLYYGDGGNSVAALNDFRPQTDKSYIHVAGTSSARTIIGRVFGGGNSATISNAEKGSIHLQLGEYVTIEDVFLGSNGAQMSDPATAAQYTTGKLGDEEISQISLLDPTTLATYMQGAAVACMPTYGFDVSYPDTEEVDRLACIGSFFGGGNVGSMTSPERFDIAFDKPIIITKKLVGGCNAATVPATADICAENIGGITGGPGQVDKIFVDVNHVIFDVSPDPDELAALGAGNQGNVFGGCFESGIVKGNVKITVENDLIPDDFFSTGNPTRESYLDYSEPANAANLFATPLSVFGGGYGNGATVEGNTTINLSAAAAALKVFGGGYGGTVDGNTTVNLSGNGNIGKLYGGGFEGPVTGNATVNLNGGTVYDVIGGACNADVAGHTEVYIGTSGFPTVTNNVYGANDFGGAIGNSTGSNAVNFSSKVSQTAKSEIYHPAVLKASAYVEYTRGSVNYIFGGAKASYDYSSTLNASHLNHYPFVGNAFVNFKPTVYNNSNKVNRVYGAGQGYAGNSETFLQQNEFQNQSYVLIDIPQDMTYFQAMEVFGSGDASGLGMGISASDAEANSTGVVAAAVVDLVRGQIGGQNGGAYGGSFQAGVTRRTIVNVTNNSTAAMNSLYGGAYGQSNTHTCDVYEANVNYRGENARIHYVYGGNNSYRRTLYGFVNVYKPIQYSHEVFGLTTGTVYGGGYGPDSWSQYTEVNLYGGAEVWEAYGGGYGGDVLNYETITEKAQAEGWNLKLGSKYDTDTSGKHGNLTNSLVKENQLYLDHGAPYINKANANVHIYKDATVKNYCYGGGYGQHITVNGEATTSATVSGTCYIDLLGGTVEKDLYGAGTTGVVKNLKHKYDAIPEFTATATAYVKGGTVRNVYGGGWEGPVGYHPAGPSTENDILGKAYVVIGLPEETPDADFYNGKPVVRRNAYGGGEGGPVFGTATISLYNGYVGYRFEDGEYVPDLDLADPNYEILFKRSGNIFGGGYARDSDVDFAYLNMYSGHVRGSLYGGGEIGVIGRGSRSVANGTETISKYKAGETHVTMYGGHVERNVFGGGRGFNNWGTEDVPDDNTNGYIFGTTSVEIHRGEVGTAENVVLGTLEENNGGYGNVFGGGDIGFVYSVNGTKHGTRGDGGDEGWYYETYTSDSKVLSEDTRVEIKVWGTAKEDVTIDGTPYHEGDYIEFEALNKLSGNDSDKPLWKKIDQSGVTIHNAVFAGGNVLAGTDKVMAFANTVYGNSTASVVDVFSRDLITIGSEGIGGLYGDGNLTLVDGYRELNISNYGTDAEYLQKNPTSSYYEDLTPRQRSFYVTKYICRENYGLYSKNDFILSDTYNRLPVEEQDYWTPTEFMFNEGRYINTIQRCDFCGIKGSRIVLRGALDRAQDESEADFTNYTINRVGELSLNTNTMHGLEHGCYFGIYNVVKFLGGVTSDVRFADDDNPENPTPGAVRRTNSQGEYAADGTTTYYQWKQTHKLDNMRNDGTAPNKIALSSGVFLEIVKNINPDGTKNYGPITGVVELDLLNVTPGEGGGYVYAENIHGTPSYNQTFADVISDANQGMVTNRAFTYSDAGAGDLMQTSGNFIHSQPKTILDDCFPEAKSYTGSGASPAHYWYIRGEFYVYEQLLSAYTGAADSYSTEISIPLTMTIQGNAKLRLLNVVPGLYADPDQFGYHYDEENPENSYSETISLLNNNILKTYGQGDPISYWDWYMASSVDRTKFVTDGYYCNYQVTVTYDGTTTTFYPGQSISTTTYNKIKDLQGTDDEGIFKAEGELVPVSDMFGPLNEVSTDNGFVLTMDFSNPSKWDDYYRHVVDATGDPIKKKAWETLSDEEKAEYLKSATFKCTASSTYGQYTFEKDAIISESVHAMQTEDVMEHASASQAKFQDAYIAVEDCNVYINGNLVSVSKGRPISKTEYDSFIGDGRNTEGLFVRAYVCVSTVLVAEGDYRVLNELVTETERARWDPDIQEKFQKAYYCVEQGSWGGKYYEEGQNYTGVDYCQLWPEERQNFQYNYDALDLMLYKNYNVGGGGYAYNDYAGYMAYVSQQAGGAQLNPAITVFDNGNPLTSVPQYSRPASLDYKAKYEGTTQISYTDDDNGEHTVNNGDVLPNEAYEALPNDRKYYAQFVVNDNYKVTETVDGVETEYYRVYIVKQSFDLIGEMYNAGKTISAETYASLDENLQNSNIETVIITPEQLDANNSNNGDGRFYFCINDYEVSKGVKSISGNKMADISFTDINDNEYTKGDNVEAGTILNYAAMTQIPNCQVDFIIEGETPVEEATLYVPVTADINSLQKDRYVTAIYEYSYTECNDENGFSYETRVEKHIINIRVKFLSGNPIIGQLEEPDLILPLEPLALEVPPIQEGAFPILSGGWEIYANEQEAMQHRNGHDFRNNIEPLYFYENGYYVSYYAETRMGKAFSDPVQVKVANYHRISDVITDEHHMYINHRDNDRDPKIYIGDNIFTYDNNGAEAYSSDLDALHQVFDLTNTDFGTEYNEEVNSIPGRDITGGKNLDFFLTSDIEYGRAPASWETNWVPIGDDTHCFGGSLHGNGRTISGLNNSIFGKLCGEVYNTGVMGTFTAGGIANTGEGRVENCWVWTTGTPDEQAQAIYANPEPDAVILNSYYPDANAFTSNNPEIMQRPVNDFVNGSVAYDLNRYYLEARYRLFSGVSDAKTAHTLYRLPDGTKESVEMTNPETDDTYLVDVVHDINYPADYNDYVTRYYGDGDFRYAEGLKPTTDDLRHNTYEVEVEGVTQKRTRHLPLYPDDYIFFGQKLTYGLLTNNSGNTIAHDWHPVAVAKNHTRKSGDEVDNSLNGLLINDAANTTENRVNRAPAYFQNGVYNYDRNGDGKGDGSVMYNANAAFASDYSFSINGIDYTSEPHKLMTAIDFTGGNGDTKGYQGVVAGLPSDFKGRADGYRPLLDYERLDGFRTSGITQNLLAYTPPISLENTKNTQTHDVLVSYFHDLTHAYDNPDYLTVAVQDEADVDGVNGHIVLQASTTIASGSQDYTYTAPYDQFLVDKQDFNAPMAYSFASDKLMWYQRTPENYVELEWTPERTSKGWIGVSIPFEAEVVTTQQKGEITHFYKCAGSNQYVRGYDSGHEYWLRSFTGGAPDATDATIFQANFNYPVAATNEKNYTNTFLWDYYYQELADPRQDDNTDEYQQTYYTKQAGKDYIWWSVDYPYSTAGMPYIVGLPGTTYFEFDLSGNFVPDNTLNDVEQLDPQVVTFLSPTGANIAVSDTQTEAMRTANTLNGYVFTPNYLKQTIEAGGYVLSADGSRYEQTAAATQSEPFRPYFTVSSGSPAKEYRAARAITFNRVSAAPNDEEAQPDERLDGDLVISSKHERIYVKSGLKEPTTVRIVNAGGALIRVFDIQPGMTVETRTAPGIYIVNKKKVSVR